MASGLVEAQPPGHVPFKRGPLESQSQRVHHSMIGLGARALLRAPWALKGPKAMVYPFPNLTPFHISRPLLNGTWTHVYILYYILHKTRGWI